jgi:AcrR family transcriptional regulator
MRKSAELRKAEIVSVVLTLADRLGPDRVTTGAVATEIGVTQAALFRHFPTKSALWKTVAEHISSRLGTAWAAALSDSEDSKSRLEALILAQLEQICATPAMPMLLFSRELNVENPDLRAAFQNRLAAFSGLLTDEVRALQDAGRFEREVPAEDIAVLLTSLVQGLAIRWSLGARNFPLRAEGKRLLGVYLRLLDKKGG